MIKKEDLEVQNTIIHDWDKFFYENLLLKEKYHVDASNVEQYFKLENVIGGFQEICSLLFGITFKEVENPSVWHEDVTMHEMHDKESGELLGSFYLDLYPRTSKYPGAAEFTILSGKQLVDDYQLPIACLVCNFPPSSENFPSLLPHEDVETFFHEFGHLVHGVLTKSPLVSYAGTSVPRDFVEAPSQMLENWVWEKESLSLFAKHYETGDIIPDQLLEKMIAAKNINSGTKALQQVFYGIYDFSLNDGFDPDGNKSTTDLIKELKNDVTLYPYQEGTHQQASFGHLNGYGAAYYGYKWSEVYAHDMFSIFKNEGILNPKTGLRYRQIILEKGGTEEPLDLVKKFLGREPNSDAFLRSMGI